MNAYTAPEIAAIQELYPRIGAKATAEKLGRPLRSVTSKAGELGVQYQGAHLGGQSKQHSDVKAILVASCSEIMGRAAAAEMFGLTIPQVDWLIKRTR